MNSPAARRGAPAPWGCLAATVAWTWMWLGGAALTGQPWLAFPTILLSLAGFAGPIVVPSLFIAAGRWEEALGRFWRRSLDPRTLPTRWYVLLLGLIAVIVAVPPLLTPGVELTLTPAPVAFLIVGALAGAAEEPAWRGYGQEALQRRLPVLAASLVVAGFWIAWHLPMFLLEGTYQHGLGVATTEFWTFNAALLAAAPVYAWLYNTTGRVVFSAVFFHAIANVASELTPDGDGLITLGVAAAIAGVLTAASWRWMRHPIPRAATTTPTPTG